MKDFQIFRFEEIADPQHPYAIGDGDHGAISTKCYQDFGIPYIRVGDMVGGKISIEKMVYIPEEVHTKNIHQELVPGDIIIAKTGATIGKVAVIPQSIPRANTTASVGKISIDHSKVDVRYFFHYLQTHAFTSQMWKVSHKSAQPGFNVKDLKNFTIPLPPLNEQKRIAAMLDKADEIKFSAQEATIFRSKIIHSVYHSIMEGADNWPVVKLSEVTENLDSKRVPIKASERINGPYPYYGANGQQGSVHDYIFDEPLILIAEDGGHFFDPERPIAYRIEGKSWVNNHAHVLRCKPDMNIAFLNYQLAYYEVRPYLTGSTRAKLTKGALMKIPIKKPPMSVQNRFAAISDIVNSMGDRLELLDQNYNSIEQEIFA